MPNRKTIQKSYSSSTRSTAVLDHVFTVERQTTPAQRQKREEQRQRNIRLCKAANEKRLEKAGGIPIVRRSIGMGKCTRAGLFIRETDAFIFYAENCYDATEIESAPVKRLKKNGLKGPHLEPCAGCEDHPSRECSM